MQPHDFLRKAIRSVAENFESNGAYFTQDYVVKSMQLLHDAQKAVKFVMPTDGKIFDTNLSGLTSEHRLPFDRVLIEYECLAPGGMSSQAFGEEKTQAARKRIVYAEQQEKTIIVMSIVAFKTPYGEDHWTVQPYISELIPSELVKDVLVEDVTPYKDTKKIEQFRVAEYDFGGQAEKTFGEKWSEHAYYDMIDEVNCVLNMMEALSCRNVSTEQLPVKNNKLAQRKKGALPYDLYHVLVVNGRSGEKSVDQGGSHRSPREHLRRGHIRRLPSGNVWVNSTIVNHGSHGKVQKAYALEAA